MPADQNRITNQVVALLNAATRQADGTPNYTAAMDDKARAPSEVTTTVQNAAMEVARAVCETVGHAWMHDFLEEFELLHGEALPAFYGTTQVPRIVPFETADYFITGVRRSFDKIESYRRDKERGASDRIYSSVAHDEADANSNPSKLCGFYDIVNNIFYFTGFRATMLLAEFTVDDVFDKLPDAAEPIITRIAFGMSNKEGDVSDGLFAAMRQMGMNDLQQIRAGATVFPPVDEAVAARGKQA